MSQIKAGDLVMVVKPTQCCGAVRAVGRPFRAAAVQRVASRCTHCGYVGVVDCAHDGSYIWGKSRAYPITRLTKIDPPALPESLTNDSELTV